MMNEEHTPTEQELSDGELIDQEPLEEIENPPVRQAGYNLVPDFGEDVKGTLHDPEH